MTKIEHLFQHLESQLDELIELSDEHKRQNHSLKTREEDLIKERSVLMKKNDLARTKVESMISRLKALEQDS